MSEEAHHLYRSQVEFSSDQIHEGSPATEFLQKPDRAVELDFFNDKMTFDDGAEHEIWAFETKDSGRVLPSPLLRMTEGEIFHATIHPSKRVHTVHWHGIEPDPRNDGVGHTSFEVSGEYTYQWQPERGRPGDPNFGSAGTYFYHCHVNTPLHVQMGMFGGLIVDPIVHPDYPVEPGITRRAFVDGPEYDLASETVLAAYAVDTRWHQMNHAAGLSGEDVGLDRYEPRHFYLLGGELARGPKREGPWQLKAIRANAGGGSRKPTLLRLINANNFPVHMSFTTAAGKPVAMAELIAHDGRPYRDTSSLGASPPTGAVGNPLMTSMIDFGAAERFDVLLRPPTPGQYRLTVDLYHWITGAVLATKVIPVTVT
ncbi:copper oxidase [Cryobacterium suzukii]|uniref:Copper oxidase n=1 Tax=Cryobacterium suzukii TaxID=1259198 RepID=A0A4R9AD07_9MICO|nr:multicopper oxidase domain-containing protein [Cryobacterium suzukii]TFD58723.1 copper oxidase [Cryobacterium suzukii]